MTLITWLKEWAIICGDTRRAKVLGCFRKLCYCKLCYDSFVTEFTVVTEFTGQWLMMSWQCHFECIPGTLTSCINLSCSIEYGEDGGGKAEGVQSASGRRSSKAWDLPATRASRMVSQKGDKTVVTDGRPYVSRAAPSPTLQSGCCEALQKAGVASSVGGNASRNTYYPTRTIQVRKVECALRITNKMSLVSLIICRYGKHERATLSLKRIRTIEEMICILQI